MELRRSRITTNSFQNDPGFQTSVNYGLQQIQAQNAAQGMGLSGNALAALQDCSSERALTTISDKAPDLFRRAAGPTQRTR